MQRTHKRFLALLMALMMLVSCMGTVLGEATSEPPVADEALMELATEMPEPLNDTALAPGDGNETIMDDAEIVEPLPDTETPPDEEALPDMESESSADTVEEISPLQTAVETNGHAYVTAASSTNVYATADIAKDGHIFTITQDSAVLLATAYMQDACCVKVWFVTVNQEIVTGYVAESSLSAPLTDEEADVLAVTLPTVWVSSEAGELPVFVVEGEAPIIVTETPVESYIPSISDTPTAEQPLQEPTAETLEPTAVPADAPTETLMPEPPAFQPADYAAETHDTSVYLEIDETLEDDYNGDFYDGVFIGDAIVQVEIIEQDSVGRYWCKVSYLYGDDFADGTLKWTDTSTIYVLASELSQTDEQELTVTDYAFSFAPSTYSLRSASYMNGFSLKNISAPIPSFYAGQGGVYGSSGKDSAYLQIAKAPDYGTVYATPHYLDGYTVYCLEHNLSGPGENISGGGQEPTGPYVIVDIDSYMNSPGYSGIIFSQPTMHAIAWVIRHSYPFMALDRSDTDNETWSRVAGQFAIREVIKQMEGAQYVRYYWDMDNFYRASGQAPAEYLEYARWLAANGIARGRITGNITVSNKSVTASGGSYVGTVTLTTDADRMRISRSVGTLTGNTAGEDGSYYYLNSGDTISVSSASSGFTITAESVSSEDEEASFLVGVPSVEIQKVIIPQYGAPYKLKSVSVTFEVPLGAVSVTKKGSDSGAALAGATFELLNSAGTVIQTQATGANGVATFSNLQPGSYTVRETGAPTGYLLAATSTQGVTVTAGSTASVTFTNAPVTAKIKIVKKDQLTGEPLAGVEFTVTRLSAPSANNTVGSVVTVITTDANGMAETGWLDWGRYKVEETRVPPHFVDNHFSTEIEACEDGKIYEIMVENEPAKGWIRLTKTDRQNGNPIAGVQFDIYYNDEYGTGLAGSMVTGADGVAISDPLRKGRYIVRESGATEGYVFETVTLDATVKPDETTELTATNRPVMVKLKLYKRDAEEYDGDNPNASARAKAFKQLQEPVAISAPATRGDGVLIGAEFQVLAGENITDRQGNVIFAKGDVVIASLKTAGEDASVTTDELWPGLYEIVELTPPIGYAPSDTHFFVDTRSAAYQSQEAVIVYDGLKTNKILYGALEIVKFLGDNLEHVGAGVVETPEQGAEFEVYLKSAGSYENARSFERDYLTTNRYGKAKTKALPYGVYVLRQVAGKDGHALMVPIDFMIDGTEDVKDPPSLILNNQAIHYRLKIVKVDAETGKPIALAGTAFRLKDADGNIITQSVTYPTPAEIDTFLTDKNGEVTLPETVTWGQYFIEEVQSPHGYLLNAEPVEVFVGHTGDTAGDDYEITVQVPNVSVKGQISLEKKGLQLTGFEAQTDAYGNEYQQPIYEERYLAGAAFEVYAAEDVIGYDGTAWYAKDELVDTITTTAEGADSSKELPLGNYYLVEIAAPAGYAFEANRYEANLTFADNQTPIVLTTVTASNAFLPAEISLRKEKETLQTVHGNGTVQQTITNVAGEGFVFGLFNATDIHYDGGTLMADTLVATGVTDRNGCLSFSGNYPHGTYAIKELSAPAGWKLNPNSFPITLDPAAKAEDADVIRVSLPDAVHDELIYTNVTITKTDITGEKTLPSATIEVSNSAGEVIYRAVTDRDGSIPDIPVTPGTYTFKEILAPEGYALNTATFTFTVDENGNVTGDTTIRDDYTRFTLQKLDENNQPLAGVEFGLLKADGTQLFAALSDARGIVTFEKIPYGSYTLVENQPLPGYLKSNTRIELTVDGQFVNPSAPVATVINRRMQVQGIKVDTSGRYLAGVEFSLINAATGKIVEIVTSNERGEFIFTKLDYGDWFIRETRVPEGYSQMADVSLHIDESWTEPMPIRCVNIPNHYEFIKVDNSGNPLSGVKFALEDTQGTTLRELISDEDGVVRVTDLAPGAYVIRETEALEGFIRTEETIRLTIDESYVVPDEMARVINYTGIQTGFEITMTPVMWAGVAMIAVAGVLAVCYGKSGKKGRGKKRRR